MAPPADSGPVPENAGQPPGSPVLRALATIGSPIALVTALAVYYGWDRTSAQAEQLGYDAALLHFSVQDYLLRSVDVLFVPLTLLLVAALAFGWAHHRILLPATRRCRGPATALHRTLTGAAWVLGAGLVGLTALRPRVGGLWFPYVLTAVLACALYADVLRRHADAGQAPRSRMRMLVLLVLALTVFWDTQRIATAMGEGRAASIGADPDQLVAVTVYSRQRLALDLPGVVETAVDPPEPAYRFRYDGLRMLQHSDNRYFLIGAGWDPGRRRVVLLRETDDLRLEFSRTRPGRGRTGAMASRSWEPSPEPSHPTPGRVGLHIVDREF